MSFDPKPPNAGAEWKAEALRLTESRAQFVAELLRRLHSKSDPDKKSAVIFLLGEYRVSEASASLVGMIDVEGANGVDAGERKRLELWGKYPAYEALVKIGVPAVREVIVKLETATDTTTKNLGASVIRAVYGRDIGEVVLEKAAAKQTDEQKKENLKAASEIVRTGREP
jgi:hypothetical protein